LVGTLNTCRSYHYQSNLLYKAESSRVVAEGKPRSLFPLSAAQNLLLRRCQIIKFQDAENAAKGLLLILKDLPVKASLRILEAAISVQ
jgi:hypothetical protein